MMVFSWWMALMVGVIVVILILVSCFYLRNVFTTCGQGLKKADSKLTRNASFFEKTNSSAPSSVGGGSGSSIDFSPQVTSDPDLRMENERLKKRLSDLAESNSEMEARLEEIEKRLSGELINKDADGEETEADKTTMSKVLDNTFWNRNSLRGASSSTTLRSTMSEPVEMLMVRDAARHSARNPSGAPTKPPRDFTAEIPSFRRLQSEK